MAAGIWYALPVRRPGGQLTGAEITLPVSGNTVKGPKFSEYYAPECSIREREIEDEDEEYLGTWRIDGDRLCVAFPSHDYAGCVSINPHQGSVYDSLASLAPSRPCFSLLEVACPQQHAAILLESADSDLLSSLGLDPAAVTLESINQGLALSA